ncbi:MAG: hypothetical protein JW822_04845 [Spirochaetales bacterium]|nr:hypothetical protein [Spirochaetales bacterium]
MKKATAGALIILFIFAVIACGQDNKSSAVKAATIVEIKASSTLAHKDNKYALIHLVDGKTDTSWVEGVEGDGIGESVTILLSSKTKIKSFRISNGYWEEQYWSQNNRVKDIMIISDTGSSYTHTLKDTPEQQTITLPEEWETKEIKFIIQSVYPGSKWRDTALTEIIVEGAEKSNVTDIVDASPEASTDQPEVAGTESEDAADKDKQAAAAKESFPLTVWAEGFTFTLYEDGKVTAEGYGMAQCDMKFVEGTWDYTDDDKKLISYIVLQQQNCFDYEDDLPEPDWKEVALQTLIE